MFINSIHNEELLVQSESDVLLALNHSERLARSLGFLPNDQILLRLATEEAVVNALEYGKKGTVSIGWKIESNWLNIFVKQKGAPFTIKEDTEINYESRGRGLQLIRHIMDYVSVQTELDSVILHMKKKK